jgi:hypothetical protein
MSQQTRVRDLLNARTCSSRSDLVASLSLAQEIRAKFHLDHLSLMVEGKVRREQRSAQGLSSPSCRLPVADERAFVERAA